MLKKHIPNILSFSRVPFSIPLLFLTERPVAFIIFYFINVITDGADGYIARRYHWESDLGQKLEAVGDFTFVGLVLISLIIIKKVKLDIYVYIAIGFFIVFKFANVVITRYKFKQWNSMHTKTFKVLAYLLILLPPIYMINGSAPMPLLVIYSIIVIWGGIEETLILMRLKEYDANTKSIFSLRNNEKISVTNKF